MLGQKKAYSLARKMKKFSLQKTYKLFIYLFQNRAEGSDVSWPNHIVDFSTLDVHTPLALYFSLHVTSGHQRWT